MFCKPVSFTLGEQVRGVTRMVLNSGLAGTFNWGRNCARVIIDRNLSGSTYVTYMTISNPLAWFFRIARTLKINSGRAQPEDFRSNLEKFLRRWFTAVAVSSLAVLGMTVSVRAQDAFNFTYSDSAGDTGYGQLGVSANGDGSFTVTNGFFDGTAGSIVGVYTLYQNPSAPNTYATSPSGSFLYDDQLFPGFDPSLNHYGLLFSAGTVEINLWGGDVDGNISSGIYSFYDDDSTVGGYPVAYTGPATFDLTAIFTPSDVPEPSTNVLFLLAIGLAGCTFIRS
jgi:hypothetical protein